MADNLKLLFALWWRPAKGMSEILDRGSLLFACAGVLIESLLLPVPFYGPLLALAACYVPAALLVAALLGRLGGAGLVFSRDYSPLMTCTAMAFTIAHLPLAAASRFVPLELQLGFGAVCVLYFLLLEFFAVRTVFGLGNGAALATTVLSCLSLGVGALVWMPLQLVMGWIASPFFLYFAWYYLGRDFSQIGAGMRQRQSFRRMLDASTVNPRDADAQYHLGLIHQQRRQYSEAIARFRKAVEIDPTEIDAHFQLGRIAREQGRLREALEHFQAVISQDDRHSRSEILREVGALYVTARQFADARRELEVYVERRPFDPEGLYYYGQALEGVGDQAAAREVYARAIEAARTAPVYRRHIVAPWSRLAHKRL